MGVKLTNSNFYKDIVEVTKKYLPPDEEKTYINLFNELIDLNTLYYDKLDADKRKKIIEKEEESNEKLIQVLNEDLNKLASILSNSWNTPITREVLDKNERLAIRARKLLNKIDKYECVNRSLEGKEKHEDDYIDGLLITAKNKNKTLRSSLNAATRVALGRKDSFEPDIITDAICHDVKKEGIFENEHIFTAIGKYIKLRINCYGRSMLIAAKLCEKYQDTLDYEEQDMKELFIINRLLHTFTFDKIAELYEGNKTVDARISIDIFIDEINRFLLENRVNMENLNKIDRKLIDKLLPKDIYTIMQNANKKQNHTK